MLKAAPRMEGPSHDAWQSTACFTKSDLSSPGTRVRAPSPATKARNPRLLARVGGK